MWLYYGRYFCIYWLTQLHKALKIAKALDVEVQRLYRHYWIDACFTDAKNDLMPIASMTKLANNLIA